MSEQVANLEADLRLKSDKGSFAAGDRLISGIKKGIGILAGLGAVKWFGGVIEGVVSTADHLDELSQTTGVNVESLQALKYAAGFSSIGVDQLGSSLGFFSKNAEAAARGSKAQARAFRAVGVDAKGLVSGALSAEDALGKVADKFASMKDGSQKQNLARALFGKSGRELIPFLNAGSGGIAKLTAEARELGVVLDEDTIKSMAGLADEQDKLSASWQGIKNQLVAALVPALSSAASALLAWWKANQKAVKSALASVFRGLAVAAKAVYKIVRFLVDGFTWLADKLGITGEQIGIVIGALFALSKVIGIVGAALGVMGGGALLPFVLLGGVVAGVIALLSSMTFDEVVAKVEAFLSKARGWAEDIANFGVKTAEEVRDLAVDAWNFAFNEDKVVTPEQQAAFGRALTAQRAKDDTTPGTAVFGNPTGIPDDATGTRAFDPSTNSWTITPVRPPADAGGGGPPTISPELQAKWDKQAADLNARAKPNVTITNNVVINDATDPQKVGAVVDAKLRETADAIADAHDGGAP